MKKNLYFSLLLMAFCSQVALAQFGLASKKKDPLFSLGLRGGLNLSKISMDDFQVKSLVLGNPAFDLLRANTKYSTGFVGGVFARIGRKFYVQPEVVVSAKGGTFDVVKSGGIPTSVEVKYTNLDVPLLLGYKLGFLRFNAGPIASFNLSENQDIINTLKVYTSQPIDDTIKQAIFGFQAGIGLSFLGTQIDARYEGNFNEITQLNLNNPSTQAQFSQKTSLWQLSLSFRIF